MKTKFLKTILLVISALGASIIFSSPAHSASSRCFLYGVLSANGGDEKPSIADLIRLNFAAETKERCEQMIMSYCNENVQTKGYSPLKLKAYFKPDTSRNEEFKYTFPSECSVLSES